MNIIIPEDCSKIHILASGGVDSTLLLYLLSKQVTEQQSSISIKIHTFEPPIGTSINLQSLQDIVSWMENRFSIKIAHRIVKKKMFIRRIVEDILLTEGGYVYSGCNKVLYDEFTPTIWIPGDTPPVRGEPFNKCHIRPFINIDKSEIVQVFINENIMDLFHLTKSCGAANKDGSPCGGCYFCMERDWAIQKLGVLNGNV